MTQEDLNDLMDKNCPTWLADQIGDETYLRRELYRSRDRIAELEVELALERKVVQVLAEYYCMVHNVAVNIGEEITPYQIIEEATAKAKED